MHKVAGREATSGLGRISTAFSWVRWDALRRYPLWQGTIIAAFVVAALLGPFMAPQDPYHINLEERLRPPAWAEGGSGEHLLGTDQLGRDLLSRIIVGARASFFVALLGLLFGAGLGSLLGLVSGYFGGGVDAVVMRAADATLAFPILLLAILLAVVWGPGMVPVIIAVVALLWARFARLVRSEVLSVKEREFVLLARIGGASNRRIMLVHILPNVLNSIVVLLTLQVGWVIILEATLSFLGAGIPAPTPTWGNMVAGGRDFITTAWWLSLLPGVAIFLVVLAFNLAGDWLRDCLDPKLREA